MKAPTRSTAIAAGVLALLVSAASGSAVAGTDRHKPSPAKSRVAAGTLLTQHTLHEGASLPSAHKNWSITYMSEDGDGDPVVVSGSVSVPSGKAPKGGWPVLSWGHGTTGYADVCAPSAQGTEGPSAILSDDASLLVDFTRSGCPGQVPAPAPIPMDQLFAANADLTGLEAYLDAQDPLKLMPRVPVLLQAGEADTQVALAGVRGLRQAYCAYGTSVAFRSYPKLDHRPMLVDPAPRADADAWIDRVVTGKKPENSCA